MKYSKINKIDFFYQGTDFSDSCLKKISNIFTESLSYPKRLKEELLDPKSAGFGGNYVDIHFEEDYALVGNELDEGYDDPTRAKIKKDMLVKLIDEWQEIIKSNPKEIILRRDDNYNLWFEVNQETKK